MMAFLEALNDPSDPKALPRRRAMALAMTGGPVANLAAGIAACIAVGVAVAYLAVQIGG